jgi:hypothetical protein
MSKVLIAIIVIIVGVAIFTVAKQFQVVKFESLGSLFKVNYSIPSGLSGQKTNISYSTGGGAPTSPSDGGASISQPTPTPPDGFTVAQLSPYYGEVKIGNVSAASTYNSVAQFSLNANYSGSAAIDVTGWHLRSNRGDIVIPKAIMDYLPGGFGTPGEIALGPGNVLNVYSSISPVGQNFRMNACIGYLNNTYSFTPALPQNCAPVYDRSEIVTFSGVCQNYILSLWGCSVPSANQINSFSGDSSCQAILNRFNYNTCYNRNRFQSGFFSNEWRAWLGSPINFDPSHDRLLLLDRNGLLVDQYVY